MVFQVWRDHIQLVEQVKDCIKSVCMMLGKSVENTVAPYTRHHSLMWLCRNWLVKFKKSIDKKLATCLSLEAEKQTCMYL